jgi:PAS domain S-box-containing protein
MAAVEGDEMVYQAGSGVLADTSGLRIKRDGSLSGLGAAGSVLYCADTEADSRVDLEACRILGVRSMIVAPLRVDTEIIGVLKVISRKPNGFSENDVSNISLLVETMSGIIHRRQIEDRLHESEKQYRLLFQNNPHPMMAYDLETLRFVAVNEAAAHQLGYSAEELLSMSLLDIRPPEDRDRLLQMMAASGHGNYSGVWRHLRKNGTIFDVEVHSDTVVFDGHSARLALTNDARDGRLCRDAPHPGSRDGRRPTHPHRGDDRSRHDRRPGTLPHRRDGRLPLQAAGNDHPPRVC